MLKGEGLIYVKHEHRAGVSKDGRDYEFANVTLSDGLESFPLPLDFTVVPVFEKMNRGDSVDLLIDLDIGFNNRVNLLVKSATLSQKQKVV